MTAPRQPGPMDALALLAAPAVIAFLIWVLWPSSAERQHWREITADLRSTP